MNEYEEEIINLLRVKQSEELGISLLISQVEYRRGLELLLLVEPTFEFHFTIVCILQRFFNIGNSFFVCAIHPSEMNFAIYTQNSVNILKMKNVALKELNSWAEFYEAIKPYQNEEQTSPLLDE
jgi:hypothetical protein